MNELRVDIGGSNRGFVIATEETKKLAKDLQRSLDSYTPQTFKGAQMMRDQYGKAFDKIKGREGIGELFEKLVGGFGEAGEAAVKLATGPIGVVTGALSIMGEVAKKSWETMKESFELAREARTIGISTTELQRVRSASAEQGFDEGDTTNRLNRFSNKVGEAALGNKEAKNFFKDMGVEIDGKNMEQILLDVTKAFEEMRDPAEKAHMAIELFGRGGQTMIPILEQLREKGNVFEAMGITDQQTDAVLGGTWQKIHGFFTKLKEATKAIGKTVLADTISGATGYTGGDIKDLNSVKTKASDEEIEAKQKAAEKHTKDLTEAQAAYRKELESTASTQEKLGMLMTDEYNLKKAIEKAQADGDDILATKSQTELLRIQDEIKKTKSDAVKEDIDQLKHAIQQAEHDGNTSAVASLKAELSQKTGEYDKPEKKTYRVDSLSSAGLFTSEAAVNPMMEVAKQQLTMLHQIKDQISHVKSIFAP